MSIVCMFVYCVVLRRVYQVSARVSVLQQAGLGLPIPHPHPHSLLCALRGMGEGSKVSMFNCVHTHALHLDFTA